MKKNLPNRKIGVLMLATCLALGGCEKARLDEQVRTLCAKDGGVKVYETVKLPTDRFDKYGVFNLPKREDARSEDDYFYISEMHYLRQGNPEMWRLHFQVVRKSDGRVLGEATTYTRRGGDMPGPWHESSFGCSFQADISDLKKQVFVTAN